MGVGLNMLPAAFTEHEHALTNVPWIAMNMPRQLQADSGMNQSMMARFLRKGPLHAAPQR